MKARWILRIEFSRFFENHAELRARVGVGRFKDQIHRAVFQATLVDAFPKEDIEAGKKYGLIGFDRIRAEAGAIRNIFVWLEEECEYQPVLYKRVFQNVKVWLQENLLTR